MKKFPRTPGKAPKMLLQTFWSDLGPSMYQIPERMQSIIVVNRIWKLSLQMYKTSHQRTTTLHAMFICISYRCTNVTAEIFDVKHWFTNLILVCIHIIQINSILSSGYISKIKMPIHMRCYISIFLFYFYIVFNVCVCKD